MFRPTTVVPVTPVSSRRQLSSHSSSPFAQTQHTHSATIPPRESNDRLIGGGMKASPLSRTSFFKARSVDSSTIMELPDEQFAHQHPPLPDLVKKSLGERRQRASAVGRNSLSIDVFDTEASAPISKIYDTPDPTSVSATQAAQSERRKTISIYDNNTVFASPSKPRMRMFYRHVYIACISGAILTLSRVLQGELFTRSLVYIMSGLVCFACFNVISTSSSFVQNTLFQHLGILLMYLSVLHVGHVTPFPQSRLNDPEHSPQNRDEQLHLIACIVESVGFLISAIFWYRDSLNLTHVSGLLMSTPRGHSSDSSPLEEQRVRSSVMLNVTNAGMFCMVLLMLLAIFWWDTFPDCIDSATMSFTLFWRVCMASCTAVYATTMGMYLKMGVLEHPNASFRALALVLLLQIVAATILTAVSDPICNLTLLSSAVSLMVYYLLLVISLDGVFVYPINTLLLSIESQNSSLQQAVKELRETKKELQDALQVTSSARFRALMSHKIRTPLNTVIALSDVMLSNGDLPPTYQHMSVDVNHAGHRLLHTLNDVLELSAIDSDPPTVSNSTFRLDKLLSELRELFIQKSAGSGVYVRIDDLAPVKVVCDRPRLRSILYKILHNAVKYSCLSPQHSPSDRINSDTGGVRPPGPTLTEDNEHDNGHDSNHQARPIAPHVTIRMVTTPCVMIQVSDNGPGINNIHTCFKRFQHDQPHLNQFEVGSGLGLSIAEALVNIIGGSIVICNRVPPSAATPSFACSSDAARMLVLNDAEVREFTLGDVRTPCPTVRTLRPAPSSSSDFQCEEKHSSRDMSQSLSGTVAANGLLVTILLPNVELLPLVVEDFIRPRLPPSQDSACSMPTRPRHIPMQSSEDSSHTATPRLRVAERQKKGPLKLRTSFKILVVDDSQLNRRVMTTVIESVVREKGWVVEIAQASNGRQALTIAADASSNIDLIFMDVMMPVMDGLEASRRIRMLHTHQTKAEPVIIAATAAANLIGKRDADLFASVLVKPVTRMVVRDILQRFVRFESPRIVPVTPIIPVRSLAQFIPSYRRKRTGTL